MKKKVLAWKVLFALMVFSPLALFPAPSRAALLTSRTCCPDRDSKAIRLHAIDNLMTKGITRRHAEEILNFLFPPEVERVALSAPGCFYAGGREGITESLESNETVAIVITLIMLAVIIGAVEVSRH
ncbi:MAG: hypothetical protein RAO92_08120 [Candidatus Euphemobacter frigidus]|nr:hypothetical protein [Candidatus Euphemobacter frigidus]MDP8276353.1 hypothetical protein [Candidatus Euphemobacter frigidus]